MALDVQSLAAMSTVDLVKLRDDYVSKRTNLPKQGRRHTPNLSTDLRSCDDSIRMINQIVKLRQRKRGPLSSFAS